MWVMCTILCLFGANDTDAVWSQWRGDLRNGVVTATLPDPLPKALSKLWSVEVGFGFGSPVAWEHRIYVPVRQEDREWMLCVDGNTGARLWEKDFTAEFKPNPYATKYREGPFTTAAVAQGIVVMVTVTGQTFGLDGKTGKTLWQNAFDSELKGDRVLFCGNTVSPLISGEMVFVHVGDETHGRLSALNLRDGKEIWHWDGDISGYASPILAKIGSHRHLVTLTQNKLVGLNPDTGALLWSYPWRVRWRENIVMPLQHGTGIIISGREQKATLKLNIKRQGSQWALEEVWRNEDLPMYMSSPVLVGDTLIGFSHREKGKFFRMQADNGRMAWDGPGRTAQNAALLAFGSQILALTTEGQIVIFDAEAMTYEPLATYEVSEKEPWAHPLWLGDKLIVKDASHLTAWGFVP